MNANHFIQCNSCGIEFQSAFAGARLAVGCSECCPSCGSRIATPILFADRSGSALDQASKTPMIREFGEQGRDGYIFMGRGILHYQIRSESLISVHASYERNINRTLGLIENYYLSTLKLKQTLLSGIYCSIMSTFECLVIELFSCLIKHETFRGIKNGGNLDVKRDILIEKLSCDVSEHITALRYLAAFRNCLTHKHGVVDRKFLDDLASIGPIPPILYHYKVGTPLVLDPSTATSFANSVQMVAHSIFPAAQKIFEETGQ